MVASKKSRKTSQYDGPIRAAIYCRVSSEKQADNSSLTDQEEKCRAFAGDQGWVVSEQHVYHEVFSGAYLGRDQLESLREAIHQKQVDRVIVLAGDRFGRDANDRIYLKVEAEIFGVEWCSVLGDLGDKTPEGQFLSYAIAFAAEIERDAIKRRTSAGRRQRVASGKRLVGGKPPFGYRWIEELGPNGKLTKTRLETNESEAVTVRLVFSRAAKGDSLNRIAKDLTEAGIPTPNPSRARDGVEPKWSRSTLRSILSNPLYAGHSYSYRSKAHITDAYTGAVSVRLRPEEEWVAVGDDVPALVTEIIWQQARERLAQGKLRSSRSSKNHQDALLRGGIARCGYCGTSLQISRNRGQAYYGCHSRYPKPGCRSADGRAWGSTILADSLDREVWQAIRLVLANPAIAQAKLAEIVNRDTARDEFDAIAVQVAEIKRQQQNITNAIARASNDALVSELMKSFEGLDQQKRDLNRQSWETLERSWAYKTALQETESLKEWGLAHAQESKQLSFDEKRSRLDALRVVIELFRPDDDRGRWQLTIHPKGVTLDAMKRGEVDLIGLQRAPTQMGRSATRESATLYTTT